MSENRSMFDWVMFLLIHIIIIGGVSYAGWYVYGERLGVWVAASAIVAGITSSYLFAKVVPGETMMKVVLGLALALNVGYIVHNGARNVGVHSFNEGQVKKFEAAMSAAAQARTRAVASAIGLSTKESTKLERAFGDSVSLIAAALAFLELGLSIVFFAIASRRVNAIEEDVRQGGAPVGFARATTYYPIGAEARNPKA